MLQNKHSESVQTQKDNMRSGIKAIKCARSQKNERERNNETYKGRLEDDVTSEQKSPMIPL